MATPLNKKLEPSKRQWWRHIFDSVWLFPLLLFIFLLLLTSLQISGTSVGTYHKQLYGESKDPNLLANHPQSIRSDEWLVNTQLTIAQEAAGYPRINHNIHGGIDMSVAGDVPYKDWSAAFKPQNLVFFVLPLEHAFAFKWWLILSLVIVSCYFVTLRFFPGKRLLAAVFSTAVACSPFLFWWYITSTLAPFFYGFFIIIIGLRVINGERVRFLEKYNQLYSGLLYVVALSYLLISFALILYPPFQIPITFCVIAVLVGFMLQRYGLGRRLMSKSALRRVAIFVVSIFITGVVGFIFINDHKQAINAVQHTVYPGSREVIGGNTPVFQIFTTFLQPQLESITTETNFYDNQSEASNFVLFLPFLLVPGFLLIYLEFRQKQNLNWPFLLIQLLSILYIANLFVASFQPLYKLFLLNKVPANRLFIGLGFAGVFQLLFTMRSVASVSAPKSRLNMLAAMYSLFCLIILGLAGHYMRVHFPEYINNHWLVVLFALFFSVIVFCFLSRRFLLGAILFLIFSINCVHAVHPLYRGLSPLYQSKLSQAIKEVSNPSDTWISLDSIYYENSAVLGNRHSLSGVQSYPDIAFWRQVEGQKSDFIYNRYAHVVFSADPAMTSKLHLQEEDYFTVKFNCDAFVVQNVQYALSTKPINFSCTKLVKEVHYPTQIFYIYRIEG